MNIRTVRATEVDRPVSPRYSRGAMSVEIRAAVSDDIDAICALMRRSDKAHVEGVPSVFVHGAPDGDRRKEYADRIADSDAVVFVTLVDGHVVGFADAAIVDQAARPGRHPQRYVMIDNVAVAKDAAGGGVGTRLVEAIHSWAKQHDISDLRLHVWEFNNAAKRMYEKLGYSTLSRILAVRSGE